MGIMDARQGYPRTAQSQRSGEDDSHQAAGCIRTASGAAQEYFAKSPWKEDASRRTILLPAQQAYEFHLARFEVLTLDVMPR